MDGYVKLNDTKKKGIKMDKNHATEIAYKNGYNKCAEEAEAIINRYLNDDDYSIGEMAYDIAELKNKYGVK
jgi:hypothetical protein